MTPMTHLLFVASALILRSAAACTCVCVSGACIGTVVVYTCVGEIEAFRQPPAAAWIESELCRITNERCAFCPSGVVDAGHQVCAVPSDSPPAF